MSLILIVDDIPAFCEQYAYDLRRLAGHETLTAPNGNLALRLLRENPVDAVLLDLEMPVMDGFELLQKLRQEEHRLPVIVYTGTGSYDRCVRAIKLGAYSFIDKTEPMERVVCEIENALQAHRLLEENRVLRQRLHGDTTMIGESTAMARLREQIQRVAPLPSPVLIQGESGVGKELVAREIHRQSARREPQFFPINCAALPENLVESELFGHEPGAFTGATKLRRGAFETASEGTLLLDEIGELPLPIQAKLLRVLEEQKVIRLGGTKQVTINTRVVAATNRDLDTEVREGRFRQDLLYRLNVHVIQVPPLRDRPDDIAPLAQRFLEQICGEYGRRPKQYDPEVLRRLQRYDWARNNVRELRNAVARMVTYCDGDRILPEHVPPELSIPGGSPHAPEGRGEWLKNPGSLRDLKAEAERQIIKSALDRNDWRINRTAAELGLSDHASLLRVMRRHGLRRGES